MNSYENGIQQDVAKLANQVISENPKTMSQLSSPIFEDLFQGLPYPSLLVNKQGECLSANNQYQQELHILPPEYSDDVREKFFQVIEKVSESGVPGYLETAINFTEYQIAVYLLGDGETIAIVFEDITDEVKLAQDYQNQEVGLKNYLEYTADSIACLTMGEPLDLSLPLDDRFEFAIENLRILECNDRYAQFQGEPAAKDIIDKRLVEILKEPPEGYLKKIRYSSDNGFYIPGNLMHKIEPGNVEKFYYLTSIPVVDNGFIQFVWVSLQDVTEVIQGERALAKNQQRYENFIKNSHEGIALYNISQPIDIHLPEREQVELIAKYAVLTECNEAWCKITDVVCDEVMEKPLVDIYPLERGDFVEEFTGFVKHGYRSIDQDMGYFNKATQRFTYIQFSFIGVVYDEQLIDIWLTKTDVTETRAQAKALELNDKRLRTFIDHSFEPILRLGFTAPMPLSIPKDEQPKWMLDHARILSANRPYANWIGADDSRPLIGRILNDILQTPERSLGTYEQFVEADYRMAPVEVVDRGFDAINLDISYLVSMQGIVENDFLHEIWCVFRDTTEQNKYIKQIEHQSTHDSLTGLPNRKALSVYLDDLAKSEDIEHFGVMFIDLDMFKEVNDNLGHHSGDLLLKQLGPRLENIVESHSAGGLVARLGGDEFAVVFLDIFESSNAVLLGMALIEQIKSPFELDGVSVHVGGSIGISLSDQSRPNASELMKQADIAMYRAKKERLGVAIYDEDKDIQDIRRLSLMSDLRSALKEDQLFLCYQPKIDLANGELIGVEALLRWRHHDLGLIPPDEFIPVAESTDLIHDLSMFVISRALVECAQWWKEYKIPVAINLSANNLVHPSLMRYITRCFSESELPKTALEIEITESALMNNPEHARQVLQKMHDLGISIAIDDFGTGYSSLAYLKELPVTTLKIDNSFVRGILDDEKNAFIVDAVITLGRSMGMKIVGEGVETGKILSGLAEKDCSIAQGYFIGKPMPLEDFIQWYRALPVKNELPYFEILDAN